MLRLHTHALRPVEQLRYDMDRMFADVFGTRAERVDTLPQLGGQRGNPALDIWAANDDFFVAAELPGMDEADISISTIGRELKLEGKWDLAAGGEDVEKAPEETKASEETEDSGTTYYHRERRTGTFSRLIEFPFDIDVENVEAHLSAGVLTIRVPKAASAKPRRIELSGS